MVVPPGDITPPPGVGPGRSPGIGTNPAWLEWSAAVQAAQRDIASLGSRITAIEAKAYGTPATLSTSPDGLHTPLLHTFDKAKATQELKDGVAVTAAFGKAAFQAAGTFAVEQAKAAQTACGGPGKPCPEADEWRDGGSYKALLHAVVGAVSNGSAGAVAALTAEAATPYIRKELVAAGVAEGSAAYDLLMLGAKSLVGAGVGGTAGAAVAFNADANNRQLHPDESLYIKAKAKAWADRHPGISLAEAEQQLTRGALYDNDLKWSLSLKDWTPDQIASYKQAGDFLRTEAAREGFKFTALDGTAQAGFTSTPEQYRSSQYFLSLALSDPNTRRLYSDRAAITLGAWDGAVFAGRALTSAGVGVPEGVEAQLRAYLMAAKAAGDADTYAKLVIAVADMQKQGFGNVLNRLFDSAMTQGQAAVYGVWLSWMQADSAALGHTAGKVLGAALVDYAAFATGAAVLNTAGRVVEGASVVQANLVRRIEDAKTAALANDKVLTALLPDARRVVNGVELSPKLLVDPVAGWDYAPSVVAGARTENQCWSHWVGHQTEVRLASDLADQGQLVVRWGDKIGTNGADVISVNPTNGQVTLWDTKFLSADKSIKMSPTFDFSATTGQAKLAGLMKQAEDAVIAAKLPPAVEAKAIADIQAKNFFANTVGAGNARNSVPMRFCGSKPC